MIKTFIKFWDFKKNLEGRESSTLSYAPKFAESIAFPHLQGFCLAAAWHPRSQSEPVLT